MNRADVSELHYIAHVDNLASILQRGLLSHELIQRVPHRSVADRDVQERRSGRSVPQGHRLHQYVNLYFNGRNAMLSLILNHPDAQLRVSAESLAVLRISPEVLDRSGVVVTEINAAASVHPRFYTVEDGLKVLDYDEIHDEWWTDSYRHKQRMMAEVLVPHRVGVDLIVGAYVVSDQAGQVLSGVAPTLDIEVNAYMFFRGPKP